MLSKRWEIAPENPRVEEKLAAALQIDRWRPDFW